MSIDLDARIAAQREARGAAQPFTFRGITWTPLPSPPITVLDRLGAGDKLGVLAEVFGKGLLELDPPLMLDEIEALTELMSEVYGVTAGESPASTASSPTTGKPSRPTSKRTTGSTSRARSGGKARR